MIDNYNSSVDGMFTNKGAGIKYFKQKVLR